MGKLDYFAIFDGLDLNQLSEDEPGHQYSVSVLSIDSYMPSRRSLSIGNIALESRRKVSKALYVERNITVRVGVDGSTRALAEQGLDLLLRWTRGVNKSLVVSQGETVRKYFCTLSDANVLTGGGSYIEVDLVFACEDLFGYDTDYTSLFDYTGLTASTRSELVVFGGSAEWQQPFFVIYYSAITGGTSKDVIIGNNATGQQMTINRTWAAGDRLELDTNARTVMVNASDVEFSGPFPEFAPGSQTITYADGFTTRTMNYRAYYYKRYI